jgi:hypothetical protein
MGTIASLSNRINMIFCFLLFKTEKYLDTYLSDLKTLFIFVLNYISFYFYLSRRGEIIMANFLDSASEEVPFSLFY